MYEDRFEASKHAEEKIEKAELAIQASSDRARRCLELEEFKSYTESFKHAEDAVMDALISYNNQFSVSEGGDVFKYAMKVNRLLTKAEVARQLLKTVESQAKRGVKKKEE